MSFRKGAHAKFGKALAEVNELLKVKDYCILISEKRSFVE